MKESDLIRHSLPILVALAVSAISSPALANAPATKLVRCGAANCLQITGHRSDSDAPVAVNGHTIEVDGGLRWRTRLPISSVRAWSQPYARTVDVQIAGEVMEASLPVGMLGTHKDLAMLVVRAR